MRGEPSIEYVHKSVKIGRQIQMQRLEFVIHDTIVSISSILMPTETNYLLTKQPALFIAGRMVFRVSNVCDLYFGRFEYNSEVICYLRT